MTERTVRISVSGPEEVILPAIDAIALTYGWTETIIDHNPESETYRQTIPNPVTKEVKVREVTRAFWMEIIKAFNRRQAEQAAGQAALEQSEAAIMATTMTLEVL